jgi:predicted NUDIX family phosphoesterase
MAKVSDEQVLVFPRRILDEVGAFNGLRREIGPYMDAVLAPGNTMYRPRGQVEEDPSLKQIIPYCILRHADACFRYTRGKGQGEKRLHAKYSIGVGGHISAEDRNLFTPVYEEAMQREVQEEVHIDCDYRIECAAVLNDDSTPVGRVHFGIVHVFHLEAPAVRKREQAVTEAGFVPIERLADDWDRYETWSQICIDGLLRIDECGR